MDAAESATHLPSLSSESAGQMDTADQPLKSRGRPEQSGHHRGALSLQVLYPSCFSAFLCLDLRIFSVQMMGPNINTSSIAPVPFLE